MIRYFLCLTFLLGIAQSDAADLVDDLSHETQVIEPLALPAEVLPVEDIPTSAIHAGLSLDDVEALALSLHPAIAKATALVQAARCRCLQVGLPPNPTVGYQGTEIGNEGQAGQQGVFVGQKFIRGNKLQLNRAVEGREVKRLEQELAAVRLRVLTQVRTVFFETYLAQREVNLTTTLNKISGQAVATVQQLLTGQEARRTDLIQAEIEASRIKAALRQAEAKYLAGWQRLAAATGQVGLESQPLLADVESLAWPQDWQQSLDTLLATSPQISAAVVEISKARWGLQRACAEVIPDLNTQLGVQYDDATQDTVASVQVGFALPLWNRNQGAIGESRHKVIAAKRNLESVELRLAQQLAKEHQRYQVALAQADAYRTEILERAEQNLELVRTAFEAGEASYLELLTVQRTFFQANLDYLAALRQVNSSVQLLRGLLLGDEGL